MLRNQATALIRYEHIETTVPKAKELRPFVERLITIAKRGVAGGTATASTLHARRLVARDLVDGEVVGKLFDTLAPRFAERPGGYTRILRLGYRRGDSAEVAQLELVGSEDDPKASPKDAKVEAPRSRRSGVGDRSERPPTACAEKKTKTTPKRRKAAKGGQTKGTRGEANDAAESRLTDQGIRRSGLDPERQSILTCNLAPS